MMPDYALLSKLHRFERENTELHNRVAELVEQVKRNGLVIQQLKKSRKKDEAPTNDR